MALVKGYRFTWGGGIFRPKPPVFDRSWRSPSKNTVKNSTEDTCSWTRPSKIGKRKVKKPRVFQLFDLNFLVCNIFFCGSAGGRARKRIFEFLDPFSDWFSSFCDSRNTGFYSVFLFSACLTASFKTSKNLVNYAVLCYGVNARVLKSDYNRVPSRRSPPRDRCRCTFSLQVGLGKLSQLVWLALEPIEWLEPWATLQQSEDVSTTVKNLKRP